MTLKICYIWDENLIDQSNRLPAVIGRASMVHDLIVSYELIKHLKIVRSAPASYEELRNFHSELYIDYLKSVTEIEEDYMTNTLDEEYGIGYDCPPVSNMFELVSVIAGGSITAAKSLVLGIADVAINWCGGWHHAQRFGADGFCYVNDIVLAIETLRNKFPKVLYIDLDVHHGNGVQDAFNLSKSVFTLSFHKYEPGFYPGTGSIEDIGSLAGKGYSCNFPLNAWYSDEAIEYIFEKVFTSVFNKFAPDAVVVQCGADALAQDPQGGARLTTRGYCACVAAVLDKRIPTLLLGGGGYNHANTARLWTTLTALVTGVTLDENIPEHQYWTKYGPGYMLPVEPTLARDTNKKNYLDECISTIRGNLQRYLETCTVQEPMLKKRKVYDGSTDGTSYKDNMKRSGRIDGSFKNLRINKNPSDSDKEKLLNKADENIKKSETVDVYDFID